MRSCCGKGLRLSLPHIIYVQYIFATDFLLRFYGLLQYISFSDLDLPTKVLVSFWLIEKRCFKIGSSVSQRLSVLTCRSKVIDFFLWPFT